MTNKQENKTMSQNNLTQTEAMQLVANIVELEILLDAESGK